MNKLPDRLPSIERFIQRVTTAEKTNQKEVKLTVNEAKELVTDLALITSKLAVNLNEIHSKLDKLTGADPEQITVKMDGGSF